MKKYILIILTLLTAPVVSNAQSDCSLDFIWELVGEAVAVQAVDLPEGAELTFTINGIPVESVDDAIMISGLALLGDMTVCIEYTSSDCPDGFELCETVSLQDIIANGGILGGGGSGNDCIDTSLIDPTAMCPMVYMPVCGCDGVTYGNECEAQNWGGVTSWTDGPCDGGEDLGCYDDNGNFYLIGEEFFVSECEYYYCETGNNWSALQELPGCGNDCEFEVSAIEQEGYEGCNWLFEISPADSFTDIFWDFGDGETGSGGVMTEHMYDGSGMYVVTASFWNGDCGLITVTTEFYVDGCGDVMPEGCVGPDGDFYAPGEMLEVGETWCDYMTCALSDSLNSFTFIENSELYPWECNDEFGCYDNEGVFYTLGSQLWVGECEFLLCEGNGDWSDVQEIPGCEGDCVNEDLINNDIGCSEIWYPVCGCDGVTYGNECEALNYGGVTEWTIGECEEDSISDDCFILYDWFLNPNGLVIAEAYEFPYGAELVWTVNGDTIAVGENSIAYNSNNMLEPFELCVSFEEYDDDEEDDDEEDNDEEDDDDDEEYYDCDGAEYCEVIAPIIGGMGCYDPTGQFYPIGFELWMNECQYMECMPPGYWSELIEIEDCGNEIDCELGFEYEINPNGYLFVDAYGDYTSYENLVWYVNGAQYDAGTASIGMGLWDVLEDVEICVAYISEECGEVYYCEQVWEGVETPDCTLELWSGSNADESLGMFEAYDYPEGAVLFWTVNGEFVAQGTHYIEIPVLPFVDYVVCVGYETPECPEGVFECVDFQYDDSTSEYDCEVVIESFYEGNNAIFHAYDYPEDVWLGWMVNGEFVSDSLPVLELPGLEYGVEYEVCVMIEGANCWAEDCESFILEGENGCPEEIYAIPPKWGDWCTWGFEVVSDAVNYVQWDFGNNNIATSEDSWISYEFPNSGEFIVTAFVLSDDCPNGIALTTVIDVYECDTIDGISEGQSELDWSVYPVPTNDQVRVSGLPEGSHIAQIFDPQGRVVLTESITNGQALDLNALRNGWYTMQIVGIPTSAKRVVIQR